MALKDINFFMANHSGYLGRKFAGVMNNEKAGFYLDESGKEKTFGEGYKSGMDFLHRAWTPVSAPVFLGCSSLEFLGISMLLGLLTPITLFTDGLKKALQDLVVSFVVGSVSTVMFLAAVISPLVQILDIALGLINTAIGGCAPDSAPQDMDELVANQGL